MLIRHLVLKKSITVVTKNNQRSNFTNALLLHLLDVDKLNDCMETYKQ